MSEQYFLKPKKAKADHGEGWWYANKRGIEVYWFDGKGNRASIRIRRSDLLLYINRTAPARAVEG